MKRTWMILAAAFFCGAAAAWAPARAHDTWVEVNTPLVRVGELVHADLKLGNHGNNHRDFKLAGRINPDWTTFELVDPQGGRKSLKESLAATAAGEKEGYWTTPVTAESTGVYTVLQTLDRVMMHGKSVRGVRTGKTLFVASKSLDKPACDPAAVAKPLGLAFELTLETCPLQGVSVERPLEVRLWKNGKPLADTTVSFIPRGAKLTEGFDERYERKTDAEGRAAFTPTQGNLYLIVAHHTAADEKTAEYESTSYATTLTVHVPQKCACCFE